MGSTYLSEEDVGKLLEILKIIKAPGALLQIFHNELSKPIDIIFTKSIQKGKLPLDLRIAPTDHQYTEKRNRKEVSNYRPLSMTSVIMKII